MRIIDVHVHQGELIDAKAAESWLEQSGVDACHLFSIHPHRTDDGGRKSIENLAEVARALPGRIRPFAWIDPLYEDAPRIAAWAVRDCGMVGFKMIPRYWYPDHPKAKEIYGVAQELGVPIQFHSGILWLKGDTSKYNQPVGYEVMFEFPKVRFSLAHIGWPWVDECIAVVQKFKVLNGRDESLDNYQAFIDLTPGTPLIYRKDALLKCINCVGVDYMMFGSDSGMPGRTLPEVKWQTDRALLAEVGCTPPDLEKVFAKNAERFLRLADD